MTDRPVIGFLSDFGLDGAAAICRGVVLSIARDAQIVDICHTVRKYAIADGAYLLAAALPWLPIGAHFAVVDPGVGTDRRPIALRTVRGDVLIGPDNGLLLPAAERLDGIAEARVIHNRAVMLPRTSATFHGRDLFAPAAAHLATGFAFESLGPVVEAATLIRLALPTAVVEPGGLATGATYVDSFGNIRLAGSPALLSAAIEGLDFGTWLAIDLPDGHSERARWLRTFGESEPGALLLYGDSSGNIALALSSGDAAARLGIEQGAPVGIRPA